jgi:hypothetical protein
VLARTPAEFTAAQETIANKVWYEHNEMYIFDPRGKLIRAIRYD